MKEIVQQPWFTKCQIKEYSHDHKENPKNMMNTCGYVWEYWRLDQLIRRGGIFICACVWGFYLLFCLYAALLMWLKPWPHSGEQNTYYNATQISSFLMLGNQRIHISIYEWPICALVDWWCVVHDVTTCIPRYHNHDKAVQIWSLLEWYWSVWFCYWVGRDCFLTNHEGFIMHKVPGWSKDDR